MIDFDSPHLIFRCLRQSDFEDVLAYRSHPDVCRYIGDPMSPEDVRSHIERCQEGWVIDAEETRELQLNLAIQSKELGKVIGEAKIKTLSRANKQVEIGGALHPKFHGKQLGIELMIALLAYCFEELGTHRIVAFIDVDNRPSLMMADVYGGKREGLLRENARRNGEWRDQYIYSVLVSDWANAKEKIQNFIK